MFTLQRLQVLLELERKGTLAEVARALSYSPSAVSQQLSQLESEAGVKLLEPVGRRVRLTTQGKILAKHAAAIMQQVEEAESDIAASLDTVTGTLRVASFQTVVLALIPATLSFLSDEYPELRIEITESEAEPAMTDLLAHDVDVVLGEEYPDQAEILPSGVHREDLGSDEYRLALPLHGSMSAVPSDMAELADAAWIFSDASSAPGRWSRNLCRNAGFEPDVRFVSNDLLLQVHLVRMGQAVAFLPDLLGDEHTENIQLHPLTGHPSRQLFTSVRAGMAEHPAVLAFRHGLRQAVYDQVFLG